MSEEREPDAIFWIAFVMMLVLGAGVSFTICNGPYRRTTYEVQPPAPSNHGAEGP